MVITYTETDRAAVSVLSDIERAWAIHYALMSIHSELGREGLSLSNCHDYIIAVVNVVEHFNEATLMPNTASIRAMIGKGVKP